MNPHRSLNLHWSGWLFLWLILGGPMKASEEPTVQLSLADCLGMALQRNLDIQIQKESPTIARYHLKIAYARYEPTFSAGVQRDGSQEPGGVDDVNRPIPGSESDTDSWRANLGGLLPWGLSYSVGANMFNRSGLAPGGSSGLIQLMPFEFSTGQAGFFELRQPLLRNAWIDEARLNIRLNRASLKSSELALRQQIMRTAHQVEITYYNLISALDNVRVSEKALELADRLLAMNRKRVEVGSMAPMGEKEAESEVATRRADLLANQRRLEDQQNLLKGLLTDDYAGWTQGIIRPASGLNTAPIALQLSDSWMKAMTQRPDLLESKINLEKQDITIRYQKNQLFPQFDLVGSYGWAGGGDARDYGDVASQWAGADNPFYSVGAQFTIPLGNSAARNHLRASLGTRKQLLLGLKKLEQSILLEVDNAVGQVRTALERVKATQEARRFSEAALEVEQKKLEDGKSTSFEVLRVQRDLVSTAYNEIRALADYNIALANLALSEGSTLDRLNLSVELR
ncbi:MAG TPA: TolC family protein [Candidatus Paceibacterota bacterium]|nr:TolC family protein [Verrucomicrobiota bacterium]HRY47738.1 TolC family protein [Candidatus Paceibacterota bacterium]HSA01459.1 TolC family protein [Candidatus Paceibacterota bacterium]